jgi:hypothetical protein
VISDIEQDSESGPSTHDVMTFTCPRCQATVQDRFYGPCAGCAQQLRSQIIGEASDVVAPEYEPKMNVTPNAVALKED